MTDTTQRLWQMTRLGDGDYLLPSNDKTVVWRLQRYDEDGSATRYDGTVVKGTFWYLLRWRHTITAIALDDLDDPNNWAEVECMIQTRKAAIEAAMSYEPTAAS